jgi:hypothetical protein
LPRKSSAGASGIRPAVPITVSYKLTGG